MHRSSRNLARSLSIAVVAVATAASAPRDAASELSFFPGRESRQPASVWTARGPGVTVGISDRTVTLSLASMPQPVALRFLASAGDTRHEGIDRLPGTVNDFRGADPDAWRRGIATYRAVALRQLYPGVDLVLEGASGALKGTFHLAAGRDPARIRWRYAGVERVVRTDDGDLELGIGGASLVDSAPVAWQEHGDRRLPVPVSYLLHDDGSVGFAVGPHDPMLPLVIDPYLEYATLVGGGAADEGRAVAVDAAGNVYVTGSTRSVDFPSAGPPQPGYGGPTDPSNLGDAFILKLAPDGETLVWMTYLGGGGQEVGDAIAIAPDGGIVVTGTTESTDFPTARALQADQGGQSCSTQPCNDLFVAKLDGAGDQLVFSTYLGGSADESAGLVDFGTRQHTMGLDVDRSGAIYLLGTSGSDDFPVVGGFQGARAGLDDLVLVKLAPDGGRILYSTYLGGAGAEYSGDVAADDSGRAWIAGGTLSSDFPTRNALDGDLDSPADAVVAAVDTGRTGPASLLWSTYLGGSGRDQAFGVGLDSSGNAVVAGWTGSDDFPLADPFQAVFGSAGQPNARDAFLSVVSADGSGLMYSSYLGGSGSDVAYDLAVDPDDIAVIAGPTQSDDLPVRLPYQSSRRSGSDAFVAGFDLRRTGDASLRYASYLGGDDSENAYGVAVDADGAVYVTGVTGGTVSGTFPVGTTIGPNRTTDGAFVARIPARAQSWVLVGSRANGANRSIWRTDLGLFNSTSRPAAVEVRFHGRDGTVASGWTVPPRNQLIVEDIVGTLGASGSGAIEVLADRDVKVTSRTFNLVDAAQSCYPGGTLGQGFGASPSGDLLRDGDRAWIPQLSENDAYRTNIAVTNAGNAPATVAVVLYDDGGRQVASYTVDLAPGEWRQENRPYAALGGRDDIAGGYARITVTGGAGVTATGSVVDNVTNDPTTVPMVPEDGAGATTTWVLVASRADGANDSIWRTDLGLLNVTTSDAEVTVRLHTQGGVLETTASVPRRGQVVLEDVVGRFPFSGSGALEIVSDQPLVVTSRIYNRVAAGQACFPDGTLGQENAGYPAGRGLSGGDAAWLVQLTENDAYRTNIALTNTGDTPATVTVRLFGGDGTELASYAVTLAAGQWRQENRPFARRGGRTDVDAGYARVEVDSGTGVLTVASVVDNVTNDPTTIVWIR